MVKVYTTKQVAELLGVKPSTILQYIGNKELEAKSFGRTYLITEDKLLKFLA